MSSEYDISKCAICHKNAVKLVPRTDKSNKPEICVDCKRKSK